MSESRAPAPGRLRRRVLHPATLISFGAAILLLVALARGADISIGEMLDAARGANPLLVAAALMTYYVNFPLRGVRWRLLARNAQHEPRPLPSAAAFSESVLLGWFVNAISWFRMGDPYRAYLISRQRDGESYPLLLGTLVAERVVDIVTFAGILALSGAFLLGQASQAAAYVAGLSSALGIGAIILIVALALFGERATMRFPQRIRAWVDHLRVGAVAGLRGRRLEITVLSMGAWAAEAGRLFLVSAALGLDVPLPVIVFVALAHNLITAIPATPGGLGLAEAGMVGLLLPWMPLEQAAALTALDRSISWLSVVVVGAAAMAWREGIRRGRFW